MIKQKKIAKAVGLVLSLSGQCIMAQGTVNGATYLAVEDASGGTLTGPDEQHLHLTLRGVKSTVTLFSDRPIRNAYALSTQAFYDDWTQLFASSAPNAVLTHRVPGQAQPNNIVLTLTNPLYDSKKKTVQFDAVRVVQDVAVATPKGYSTPTVKKIITPKAFGSSSLYIDNLTTQIACDLTGICPQ